jgi:hypothetical protein
MEEEFHGGLDLQHTGFIGESHLGEMDAIPFSPSFSPKLEPMSIPNGVLLDGASKMSLLADQHEALSRDNARLAQENALAHKNAALAMENARLAQENMMLRMQQATDAAAMLGPPWCQQWPGASLMPGPPQNRRWSNDFQNGYVGARNGRTGAEKPAVASRQRTVSDSAVLAQGVAAVVAPEDRTTVMMRNIPNNYTRQMLLDLVDGQGFQECYELVYLPVDFKTDTGLGYAFIDLCTPAEAQRFFSHFQGFAAWGMLSEKVCEVSWSDVLQGRQAHVERYRDSFVMHESVPEEFKPALFSEGKRIPFPGPTKKLRAPRPCLHRQPLSV